MKISSLIIGASLLTSSTFGQDIPEFTSFFRDHLDATESAIASCSDTTPEADTDSSWYLRRFWLRIRPKAAIKIPGLAKVEIIPEVELLWQRELPDGMTAYKPQ